MDLVELGWDGPVPAPEEEDLRPARVAREDRGRYVVLGPFGAASATAAGRLRHHARDRTDLPVVGDWVEVRVRGEDRATIVRVRPRRTLLVRKVPGGASAEQPLAANVDVAFVVTGLDGNYRLRRIERYLTLVHESGARPVVVLSKADLVPDADRRVLEAEAVAPGVPVLATSAVSGDGIAGLSSWLGAGATAVFLGSSGVGKSTLVNRLLGEERLATTEVRDADSKGRHTTTRRELFLLPDGGGIVIDTPGLRELQLAGGVADATESFADVMVFAEGCRFRDCRHRGEPGCAVQRALAEGDLDADRYESWLEQKRELAFQERRRNVAARLEETRRWRRITRQRNQLKRNDPRRR